MIIGAHALVYSRNPGADRRFFRDVLGLTHVDAGGGWLIFGLPPAEVAVHPSDRNDLHELYLMTDDVEALRAKMKTRRIPCSAVTNERWGLVTHVTLPGGGKLGIYEPRHTRPEPMGSSKPVRRRGGRLSKRRGARVRRGSRG